MKVAIYPGSFDPITNGHLDVLERALKIFDKIIIAVGEQKDKNYLFNAEERVTLIQEATKHLEVEVKHFKGTLVDFAEQEKATAIVRGLRAVSDFDHEFQLALMNRKLNKEIETVFIMTRGMYSYLSSSIVKEAAQLKAKLDGMVPKNVEIALSKKF
jgi:pantetheine-phosphate adenylyltransferase|tara:strand:+ start:1393 stop:1863 length:471 start_codon:yes stop_codon:yes gene_type:complete